VCVNCDLELVLLHVYIYIITTFRAVLVSEIGRIKNIQLSSDVA